MVGRRPDRLRHVRPRIESVAAGSLCLAAAMIFTAIAPQSSADKVKKSAKPPTIALDKKFKGALPITELTADQATLHALNRLGYGPRPGDVERIRQMGLEKWIDQQLHPERIDDAALDQRLDQYSTLNQSSTKLLDEFPPPGQAVKREGVTKDDYKEKMEQKRQDALAQMLPTGNENFDRANDQLAKIQGPNRIVAELSMAKVDRAVYSQRQLEAVMEDFWFNHFNVFANKGADKWFVTAYVRDTIRPRTMGKFQDLLVATAKSPAMLFYLDNWMSADPAAFKRMQAEMQARRRRYQGIFTGAQPPPPGTFPGKSPVPGGNGAPPKKKRGPRAQRELRARSNGATHRRRRCRLYATRRNRDGRDAHRLDRPRAAQRPGILFRRAHPRAGQESCDGPHLQLRRRERRRGSAKNLSASSPSFSPP